jgi:flagellar L-ring protein FlgH
MSRSKALILVPLLWGCGQSAPIGRPPDLSPVTQSGEFEAMMSPVPNLPLRNDPGLPASANASLWTGDRGSLLGDNRAMQRGDILTVVIEIDEGAQITNSSEQGRQGGQELEIGALFGLPERAADRLPEGASLSPAVALNSSSAFSGEGSVRRNEQLTLRIAATVVDVLPNGILAIGGSQEVRVNNELRELLVSGFVRPADVSRQNEITYDNLASARISYGGRGQITAMQEPRVGQQILDGLLPF